MAEISDVRQLFYDKLKLWADAQSPVLRIAIQGLEFKPNNDETYLRFAIRVANPSKPFAGTWYNSQEKGFCQVDIVGPERRLQKAFEKIAWSIREAFWPSSAQIAPTLGTSPMVRLGPTAPRVIDHPAPDDGQLGSIVTIDWTSDFTRT